MNTFCAGWHAPLELDAGRGVGDNQPPALHPLLLLLPAVAGRRDPCAI